MSNTRNSVVIGGSGGGLSYTVASGITGYPASVASITLPPDATSIGAYAFYGCSSLASITIPSGVTSIATYAFTGCSSLASITIPSGVTSIETYAFAGCSALMELTVLASTPPTITSTSTTGVPAACVIRVPAGSVGAYQAAPNWSARAAYITAI